jgi:hypothetical protein
MSNIYTDIFEAMDRIRDASSRWSSDHDLLAETKDLLARCSAKMQEMQQRSSSAEMELRSLLASAQARAERAEGERSGQICGLCDKRKPCKCLMELESDATAPEVKGGAA